MARKEKMSEARKKLIQSLIQDDNIKLASDVHDALKDKKNKRKNNGTSIKENSSLKLIEKSVIFNLLILYFFLF